MSEDAFGTISSGLIATIQYGVGDTIRIYIGAGRAGDILYLTSDFFTKPKSENKHKFYFISML